MHSVKLTVLIEDSSDVDMEVKVVMPHTATAPDVAPITLRRVATRETSRDDEYALGGYAGI